jgi:hypothetical protein
MARNPIIQFFLAILLFAFYPLLSRANTGKPYAHSGFVYSPVFPSGPDTLPLNKKIMEEKSDTSRAEVIKEVPKSRKQERPIPINGVPAIIPIKIIPPKIIKPVIRVLK